MSDEDSKCVMCCWCAMKGEFEACSVERSVFLLKDEEIRSGEVI